MNAAALPRPRQATRLLVIDPVARTLADADIDALPRRLAPGDLVIVNDAATLPASLAAWTADGEPLEVRLVAPPEGRTLEAVLFGRGDWRTRTEDRPAPPDLAIGARVALAGGIATVTWRSPISPRLVRLALDVDDVWRALYVHGRPVQYSYLGAALPLSTFQTSYATRPWAAEMPSAGRPLAPATIVALRGRGVAVARLTHAAGLSATGDPALDAALPLGERYELPAATLEAMTGTRAAGGRVVAVGTTVVRALEGAAAAGALVPGPGRTELVIGAGFTPRVVDGLLTTMHDPSESHHRLMLAFADHALLVDAHAHASAAGYLAHELGDATLILPPRAGRGAAVT